jgi:TPR repeat protein
VAQESVLLNYQELTEEALRVYDASTEKAAQVLTHALKANAGYVPALLLMRGLYYRCPRLVPPEMATLALKMLSRAIMEAAQNQVGNPSLNFLENLVRMFATGTQGLPAAAAYLAGSWKFFGGNDVSAAAWFFQSAASQNQIDATVCLGDFYVGGQGVPQDLKRGYELISSAADRGHAGAQTMAAQLIVNTDRARALQYLQLSIAGGSLAAMSHLGQLLIQSSVPKDREDGFQLL